MGGEISLETLESVIPIVKITKSFSYKNHLSRNYAVPVYVNCIKCRLIQHRIQDEQDNLILLKNRIG